VNASEASVILDVLCEDVKKLNATGILPTANPRQNNYTCHSPVCEPSLFNRLREYAAAPDRRRSKFGIADLSVTGAATWPYVMLPGKGTTAVSGRCSGKM
jgi:hypothetical protein